MGKQSTTLSVLVDVNAKVDKAKAAIEVFKNSLSNIKLSDSLSGNVNKILTKLETEFANFQGLSEKEIFSEKDSKQVKKSFETIIDLMNTLQAHANTIEGLDVSKLIPKDFIDQIKSFGKELKTLTDEQKALDSSLEQKTKEKTAAEDKYNKALKARSDLEKKIDSNKNTQTAAAEEQAEAQKRINDLLEQKKAIESKKTNAEEEIKQKKKELEEVKKLIKKYQDYRELKTSDNKTSQDKSKITRFENQNQDIINKGKSGALTRRKNKLEVEVGDLEAIKFTDKEMAELQEVEEAIQKEEQIINQQKAIATKAKNNIAKSTIDLNVLKDTDGLDTLKTEFEALEKEVNEFNSSLDPTKLEGFRQKIAEFAGVKLDEIPTDLAEIEKYLIKIQSTKVEEVSKDLEGVGETAKEVKAPMEELRKSVDDLGETGKHFDDVNNDIQRLKQNIIDFFSIGNAVQLFKRTVSSAFETIKELDATMTEAAVVTEFSVGDMWDRLPEYSGEASELGAKINDLYGATTLYYQQGLKTNEAMALGTETMKMARIAGMESAAATEAMTAALRGFNMELNETSAVRVNDVYSELAAITAADTEQIATAMSKTASIASAANMEFESTAAFLSQIIETTQEAPETAGTALKTIIARFSEVKSLREKGLSTGEDSEGELIDVNKIQGALRTVGISMDEFFAGTEGLDSVLMKLASKWKTLDFETQRYIATTAAGSRQQSRFIAMMSDYDRTMELVGAANNSAGASQEQFNKTLESLDSKLNNLKNAWDQFVMGLANSELVKGAVDFLTFLLDTINKLISTLSGGSGIVKTFITAIGAIGAFKLGKKALGQNSEGGIFGQLLGKLGYIKKEGEKSGESFGQSLTKGIKNKIDSFKDKGFKQTILGSFGFTKDIKTAGKINEQLGLDKLTNFDFGKNAGNSLKASLLKQFKDLPDELKGGMSNLDFGKILLQSKDLDSLKNAIPPELYQQLGLLGEDAANAGGQLNKMSASMETLTKTAGMAGGALMMIAGILEKQGASSKLVDSIKAVGIALMLLPTIYSVVNTATKAFGIKFTATFLNIPVIGWIAAIITALIALAGILASVIDTPEEKLKKANTSLESAAEAANKLSEAYNNINESLEKIKSNEDAFDNLIEGTKEWKEALLENNQAILELIKENPELAAFVQNVDGRLVIDYEKQNLEGKTIDQVMSDKLDASIQASNNVLAAQTEVFEAEKTVATSNFMTEIMGTYAGELAFSNINVIDGSKILEDLARAQINLNDTDVITKFLQDNYSDNFIKDGEGNTELKSFALAVSKSADAINKFGASLIENEAKISTQTQLMADSFIDQYIKQANLTEEESAIAKDFGDGERLNEMANNIEDEARNNIGKEEDYVNFMEKTYGDDVKVENSGVVKDKEGNIIVEADTGKEIYSQYTAGEQMVKGAKSYLNAISQVENEVTKAVLSGNDGTNATKKELQSIFGKDVDIASILADGKIEESEAGQFVDDLKGVWDNLDEETKKNVYGGDMQKFIDEGMEKLSNATQTYANAINTQTELAQKGATFEGTDDFTANQLEGLNKVYQTVLSSSGTEGLKTVSEAMSSLLESEEISEQDQGKFLEKFNSIDWTSATAVEDFKEALSGAGLAALTTGNNFNTLMNEMRDTTVSIKTFGLGQIREEIKNAMDLVDELKDKKDSSFDDETKKKLVKSGADENDFVWNGQEFVYIGGTMEELSAAIQKNTTAILENTIAQLEQKIEQGQQFKQISENIISGVQGNNGEYFTKEDFISGNITNGRAAANFMFSGMSDEDVITDTETKKTYTKKDLVADGNEDLALRLYNQSYESFINLTENKNALVSAEQARAIGGRDADEIRGAGESEELQKAASITEAQDAELDTSAVLNYADEIYSQGQKNRKNNDGKAVSEAMAIELAKDAALQTQGSDELIEGWNEWQKALKSGNEFEAAKGLNELRKSANKMLGITENLSDDFYKNSKNQELMQKAAKGNKEAINELQKAAGKDIFKNTFDGWDGSKISEIAGEANKLDDAIEEIANTDLEVGDIATDALADSVQTVYDNAYFAAIQGGKTVEQAMAAANAAIAAEGFEAPEMVEEEITVTGQLPPGVDWKKGGTQWVNGAPYSNITAVEGDSGNFTYTTTRLVPKNGTGFTKKSENIGSGKKSGGGGGGSKKPEKQTWENPYDELHNTQEQINELLRKRNKLEEQYDRLLNDRKSSINDLLKNQKELLHNLERQFQLVSYSQNFERNQLASARYGEYLATRKNGEDEEQFWTTFQQEANRLGIGDLNKYGTYDFATNTIQINWNLIEQVEDNTTSGEDIGNLLEAYVSYLKEQSEAFEEMEDELAEIEKTIREINERNKQAYLDFEDRVYEALVQREQDIIDNYTALSDTLNKSNNEIINALRDSIDLERQIRDNTKQEEDIADMEARLAYLRRDTSGANQLEILQLEEQLADSRDAYGDTLIDQELDRLEKANTIAEEQRQRQIEIMQSQLDYEAENGKKFWAAYEDLWDNAFNSNKEIKEDSALIELLKNHENFKGMSEIGQEQWKADLITAIEQARLGQNAYISEKKVDEKTEQIKNSSKGQTVRVKNADGSDDKIHIHYDEKTGGFWTNGNSREYGAGTFSRLEYDVETGEFYAAGYRAKASTVTAGTNKPSSGGGGGSTSGWFSKINPVKHPINEMNSTQVTYLQNGLHAAGFNPGTIDGKYGKNTKKAVRGLQSAVGAKVDGSYGSDTHDKVMSHPTYKKFKTGGLADFTGPAWLDGTKSKPEIILNQQDSKNFIMLKDVLADILQGATSTKSGSGSGGDNYFDISIIVDEISSDYDVDQMAARIKQQIYEDSTYRNVNAINLIR